MQKGQAADLSFFRCIGGAEGGTRPARIAPHAPQTCAATNYATSARSIIKNYLWPEQHWHPCGRSGGICGGRGIRISIGAGFVFAGAVFEIGFGRRVGIRRKDARVPSEGRHRDQQAEEKMRGRTDRSLTKQSRSRGPNAELEYCS